MEKRCNSLKGPCRSDRQSRKRLKRLPRQGDTIDITALRSDGVSITEGRATVLAPFGTVPQTFLVQFENEALPQVRVLRLAESTRRARQSAGVRTAFASRDVAASGALHIKGARK
jgi:hypothetical protein